MDKNRRACLPVNGNAIIKPELASNRDVPAANPARHVVRVHVDDKTSSIGYRYNDDFEIGIKINTNTLIGLFSK
jgi:hypothetical protein